MMRGRGITLALLAVAFATPPARAQLSENLGAVTSENARQYLQPITKALSATFNSAVFQTGHVPKRSFNLSLGVRVMGVSLSGADRTYSPTPPPGFTPTQHVLVPTVIGSSQAVAQPGQGGTTLYYPGGFDLTQFTVAVPQLTIGSLFGTRAVVRWISAEIGDSDLGKLDYLGAGAQHSISQYLPGMPVDLAAGLFFQRLKLRSDLVRSSMWSANVTASRRWHVLEPYVGLGLDSFKMDASYQSTTFPGENISVSFDRRTNAHLTVGVQALLAFTRIQAEFDAAAEPGAAVGLSLGRF